MMSKWIAKAWMAWPVAMCSLLLGASSCNGDGADPGCQSVCVVGQKDCQGNTARECRADDPARPECAQWAATETCAPPSQCFSGRCVSPTDCVPACELGQTSCQGRDIVECRLDHSLAPPCERWIATDRCPADTQCFQGACEGLPDCPDSCDVGAWSCRDEAVVQCAWDGLCPSWRVELTCSTGFACKDGTCVPSTGCSDACLPGEYRCLDLVIERCQASEHCADYVAESTCLPDQLCLEGSCVPATCQNGDQVACPDRGQCQGGKRTCQTGAFGACAWNPASGPGSELCDGVDNDCDGATDEELEGNPCARQQGVCQGSLGVCLGAAGSSTCKDVDYQRHALTQGQVYEAFETRCDGLDNDCDGLTDEMLGSDPRNCSACGDECPADPAGVRACTNGACSLTCYSQALLCNDRCRWCPPGDHEQLFCDGDLCVAFDPEDTDARCRDGRDNDRDGATDCADPDCALTLPCDPARREDTDQNCSDQIDNDEDGLPDCADPSCRNSPVVTVCQGKGYLEIIHVDVGQGDSTVVLGSDGTTLVIDAGPYGAGPLVRQVLVERGIFVIDLLVVTHWHADHHGGVEELLSGGMDLLAAYHNGGSPSYGARWAVERTSAGSFQTLAPGTLFDLGEGAFAVASIVDGETAGGQQIQVYEENARSVGLYIGLGTFDYHISGDLTGGGLNTPDCETQLSLELSDMDVVRLNHHGSASSTNYHWLNQLEPEVVVISLGPNVFGHPAWSVIDRLTGHDNRVTIPPPAIFQTGSGEASPATVLGTFSIMTDGTVYFVNGVAFPTD